MTEYPGNLIDLDDYRAVHELIQRKLGTGKFILAALIDTEDGVSCLTYDSGENEDMESVYMVKCLWDRL